MTQGGCCEWGPPALMTNSNLTSFKCQVSQRPMRAEEAGSIVHHLLVNYKTPIGSRNILLHRKPECLSDSQCQGQKLSSSYHHRAKIGHETFPWNADSWGLMMSSMSEKPIKDDRKTDSWQDALNEIHPLLFINCLVFDNKLWNYLSKNPFQFQNSQIKTQQGYGQVDFTWLFWIDLMKSIPKVCQTSETLKIFCNQASVTFLISCR